MTNTGEIDDFLSNIQKKFLKNLNGNLATFNSFLMKLSEEKANDKEYLETCSLLHKISGSAKTFGFPEISDKSAQIERYIKHIIDHGPSRDHTLRLKESLTKFITISTKAIKESYIGTDRKEPAKTSLKESKYTIFIADDDALLVDLIKKVWQSIKLMSYLPYMERGLLKKLNTICRTSSS